MYVFHRSIEPQLFSTHEVSEIAILFVRKSYLTEQLKLRGLVEKATRSVKLQKQAEKKLEKLLSEISVLTEQANVAKKIAKAHELQKENSKKKVILFNRCKRCFLNLL